MAIYIYEPPKLSCTVAYMLMYKIIQESSCNSMLALLKGSELKLNTVLRYGTGIVTRLYAG